MKSVTPSSRIQFQTCMYFAHYIGMPVGTHNGLKTLVGVFPMFSDFFRAQWPDGTQVLRVLPIYLADVKRGVKVRMTEQNGKETHVKKDILQVYHHYVEECTMWLKHVSSITLDEIGARGDKWAMGSPEKVYAAMKSVAPTQDPSFLIPHLSPTEVEYLRRLGYCLPVEGFYPLESKRVMLWDVQKRGYDLPRVPVSFDDFLIREDEMDAAHAKRQQKGFELPTDEDLDIVTVFDSDGEPVPEHFGHDDDLEFETDDDLEFD